MNVLMKHRETEMGIFKKPRKKASNIAPPAVKTWPFWAKWCALDPLGYWIFFEKKPKLTVEGWLPDGVKWGEPRESIGNISGSWKSLLFSSQDAS
jgi:hypothetical protein